MNDIQMSLPLTVGAWSMSMMPENVRIADILTKRAFIPFIMTLSNHNYILDTFKNRYSDFTDSTPTFTSVKHSVYP